MNGKDKADRENRGKGEENRGGGKGQDKLHTIANVTTGESKQITQREWREQGKTLKSQGWARYEEAEDVEESAAPGAEG